jgi:hypothetical protein
MDGGRSRRHGDHVGDQLRDLHRQKATEYPLLDLISTGNTLEEKLDAKGAFDDF